MIRYSLFILLVSRKLARSLQKRSLNGFQIAQPLLSCAKGWDPSFLRFTEKPRLGDTKSSGYGAYREKFSSRSQ
jgi:hypothetical protein